MCTSGDDHPAPPDISAPARNVGQRVAFHALEPAHLQEKSAPVIAPGVILIRNDARLPETLIGAVSPFCRQWSFLTDNSDRHILETRLAFLGWTSSCLSGLIRRASTGIDKQKMIKTALERVLAAASLKSCDFLEIGEIKMHVFLTIRYVSVSGRARQLHAVNSPVIRQWARGEKSMTSIDQSRTLFREGVTSSSHGVHIRARRAFSCGSDQIPDGRTLPSATELFGAIRSNGLLTRRSRSESDESLNNEGIDLTLITLRFTAEELDILLRLATDQLFRKEFIDSRLPGCQPDLAELKMGKQLVQRIRVAMGIKEHKKLVSP